MFTGIIEATGTIRDVEDRDTTRRFSVQDSGLTTELRPGDSVAVDGACLTVVERSEAHFRVDVIGTTLERTIAGQYHEGSRVNLERALEIHQRIDGHLVQGHVDGIGELTRCIMEGEFWLMDFRLPPGVASLTVARGSVAINGVSLTVSEDLGDDVFRIGVIPYTYEHTNLGALEAGADVNVEGDLIGKYVGKVLAERAGK
ncbi:MAG: riboflavin synthase [Gemmatimonadota bacterium]|nr:riboflavin synthase [Gemmatimonadota bacterium]MDH3423782.1 riboflavin synthase [Gemmatimonadota bacterium]